MKAIYKREIRGYLTSPVGYVFAAFYLALSGVLFSVTTLLSMTADMTSYFSFMLLFSGVLLPLLTMKSFSEERKQKTEQVWLTAPVSVWSVVLGKFLAALTLWGGCLGVTVLFVPILSLYGQVRWAVVLGSFFALALAGAAFLGIGLFVSALTENQLGAAVGTVGILAAFLLISLAAEAVNVYAVRFVLDALSLFTRFRNFTQGIFDPASLVYYLSVTGIFLFLTVRVYERRRFV